MKRIYIVVGSARPHWLGRQIAKWVRAVGKKHTNANLVIVDAEDIKLPGVEQSTERRFVRGQPLPNKVYDLKQADGYIFITPEYKKGTSPVLEAIMAELDKDEAPKPVAFVAYGQKGGINLVEGLRKSVRAFNKIPMRKSVHITEPWELLSEDGELQDQQQDKDLLVLMKQLSGWLATPSQAT